MKESSNEEWLVHVILEVSDTSCLVKEFFHLTLYASNPLKTSWCKLVFFSWHCIGLLCCFLFLLLIINLCHGLAGFLLDADRNSSMINQNRYIWPWLDLVTSWSVWPVLSICCHKLSDWTFYVAGQVGDWRNWFTVAQNEMFTAVYEQIMAGSDITLEYGHERV